MNCPICKTIVPETPPESGKSYFPFCSERCKLIDLGRWLGGRYQIPVEPEDEDESTDSPLSPLPPGEGGNTQP